MPHCDPVADVRAAIWACKARDYNMEGIPMFLRLEDLRPRARATPPSGDAHLERLARHYLDRLGGNPAHAAAAQEVLAAHHFDPVEGETSGGPYVRVVNYHNTSRERQAEHEREILGLGERFSAVDEAGLHALLSGGELPGADAPGVLPVFYEGYRNNYEVALPMVERAGLRAWFFLVLAFVDAPVEGQYAFARSRYIGLAENDRPGRRCAMTWDELRDVVARGHVVACHTATHCAASSISTPEDARRELFGSRERLEEELGTRVQTLAWLLGAPYGEHDRADAAVRAAGYRLVFSNAKVQRIPESPVP
jgi:peptidoglycan/xylan/chitin deacetylase (PgdA/CDA1 family)